MCFSLFELNASRFQLPQRARAVWQPSPEQRQCREPLCLWLPVAARCAPCRCL